MKKIRFIIGLLTIILVVSTVFAGCAKPPPTPAPAATPTTPSPAAPAKVYKWNFFSDRTPKDWPDRQVPKILEAVEKETKGALQIKIFSIGEHAYKAADMLKVVKERNAEIIEVMSGYIGGVEPILKVYSLPFIMPSDFEQMTKLYYATRNQILTPVFDRWNATHLLSYFWPPQRFHAKVPVTSWDSLKGRKIRSWSPETLSVVNILNGTGVNIPWADTPTAIATGIVEGCITSTLSAYEKGIYDHVKVMTLFELATSDEYFLVNKAALAELDPTTRNAFLKVWKDFEPYMMDGNQAADNNALPICVTQFGVSVAAPTSQFRNEVREKSMAQIWPEWVQQAGPDGKKALDLVLQKHAEVTKK